MTFARMWQSSKTAQDGIRDARMPSCFSPKTSSRAVPLRARPLDPQSQRSYTSPFTRLETPPNSGRTDGMADTPTDITLLLRNAKSGAREDADRLMEAIYEDLRRLASSQLRGERAGHTLQPTALVHEAYLKLVDQRSTDWNDRLHFFAVASRIIRRILIDHARERAAQKRGGAAERVPLDSIDQPAAEREIDLIALDEALKELAEISERQARIVELRFFGGCTVAEVATLLETGSRTVDRDWLAAKAWLYCRLTEDAGEGANRD